MRKRIFIDLLNISTKEIAGVGVFARNLLQLWFKPDVMMHHVTAFSSDIIEPEKVLGFHASDQVVVERIAVRHVLARFLFQQIILPFKLRDYDLYYNPALGIPFLATIISPKTKLIVTIHDMIPFFFKAKYSPSRAFLVKKMSICAARAAHHVITVSENSKKDIIDITNVKPGKVTVVYNVSPYQFNPVKDHKDYFVCISTIEPGKNLEKTMSSFRRFLTTTGFDYHFYWLGRIGWVYTKADLDRLLADNKLEGRFHFVGYVDEKTKKKYISESAAIVYLSHYEGFGLPVIEGMAFNKPAVVSNNSSLPEVVGNAGVVCDATDDEAISQALRKVLEQRESFVSNIPDQLRKFDAHRQLGIFLTTINSFLQ
jgi:glycosyltransferase involved in cell wall biosynthesis